MNMNRQPLLKATVRFIYTLHVDQVSVFVVIAEPRDTEVVSIHDGYKTWHVRLGDMAAGKLSLNRALGNTCLFFTQKDVELLLLWLDSSVLGL